MGGINLLVSKTERKAIQLENQKNRYLWIGIICWTVYLIFSFIQVEFALMEKSQLEQSINQLKSQSNNQRLNQQISFTKEKISIIETIETINQTIKQALLELNQLIANNGKIESIQSSINSNQAIEILVNLSFRDNQDSGRVLEIIKQKSLYKEVIILSSNSINGMREIELQIIADIQKSKVER